MGGKYPPHTFKFVLGCLACMSKNLLGFPQNDQMKTLHRCTFTAAPINCRFKRLELWKLPHRAVSLWISVFMVDMLVSTLKQQVLYCDTFFILREEKVDLMCKFFIQLILNKPIIKYLSFLDFFQI